MRAWFGALAVCAVLFFAIQLLTSATYQHNRGPQLVMSEEARAAMGLPRLTQGEGPKVSREVLDALLKAIPTCTVGKRYGALCVDGTYIRGAGEDACDTHKGVKEWVECR